MWGIAAGSRTDHYELGIKVVMTRMSAHKPNYIPVACSYAHSRSLEIELAKTQHHEMPFGHFKNSIT
jgi:hypothetical protein